MHEKLPPFISFEIKRCINNLTVIIRTGDFWPKVSQSQPLALKLAY